MNIENLLREASHSNRIERMLQFMDNIEYRRVRTFEDLDGVAKLRSDAYKTAEIFIDSDVNFIDKTDLDPRVFVFSVYWFERLVATVRIDIINSEFPDSNTRRYFSSVVDPLLDQGLTFVDSTRFVIVPGVEKEIPFFPAIVLRLVLMAGLYFNCDNSFAMIREGHGGFYRKVFNFSQIAPLKHLPGVKPKYALYSASLSHAEKVCKNYPILDSLPVEARLLFSNPTLAKPQVLSVKPTARLALRNRNMGAALLQAAQ